MTTSRPARGVARWVFETRRRLGEKTPRNARREAARMPRPPVAGYPAARYGLARKAAAWSVHLYTALGLVCAAAMALQIQAGKPENFRAAFLWMIVATIIDATDGFLARRVGVKQVLPGFDGRRLDDITDFLTYTFMPLLLMWRAGLMPAGQEAWLILPLLASAYGFCQADIKTADGCFLGFPSLWNVVAIYLYVLHLPASVNLGLVIALSILTFVPTRYPYPSQPGRMNRIFCLLGCVWMLALVPILLRLHELDPAPASMAEAFTPIRLLTYASLAYPIAYVGISGVLVLIYGRQGFGHTSHTA